MRSTHSIVPVLALRLGRPASTIHPRHDLARDLGMTPLDAVLVALDVEEAEDVDIDVEGLLDVRTVDELSTFLTDEVARAHGAQVRLDVA